MAGHQLIDQHLAELARRLPAQVVDELADGLQQTWQHHLTGGLPPVDAARAAIAEFGTTAQITAAFTACAPGRRTAQVLLVSGPVAGLCWGVSLIAGRAWTWPVPTAALIAFGMALFATVATLLAAATSRRSYHRTRLGGLGGLGLLVLDAAMLTAVIFAAPGLVWPMAFAVPFSLARIGWTLRTLPATLAR